MRGSQTGQIHLVLSLHQSMLSMGPSRGKISVRGFTVRSWRPLRSEPSHQRLITGFKAPRRTDLGQGLRGNLSILILWLSNNPQTGTNSEPRTSIPLSVGPERRRLVGWSRGECTIAPLTRTVPTLYLTVRLAPPHHLSYRCPPSLRSHVVSQFSYYDACVLRSSSVPQPSELPLIRSSFRVCLSLPLHYIPGPHAVCAEFSPPSPPPFHLAFIVFYTYSRPYRQLEHRRSTYTCRRFILNSPRMGGTYRR